LSRFNVTKRLRLSLTGSTAVSGDVDFVSSAVANGLTLTGSTTGITGVATTFTVTPNGTMGSTVVVTPAATNGGSVNPATLSFVSGSSTALTFNTTRASNGVSLVSITNNGGLSNFGTPITHTTAADASWVSTPPTISFPQGIAATHNLAQYTTGFNTDLHEMQMADDSNALPTGVTLSAAGVLTYDGVSPVAAIVNVQIDIEDKVAATYLQLVETDRVSWLNASGSSLSGGLGLAWLNAGGDWRDSAGVSQGTTHYATASVLSAGGQEQSVQISVTALVTALLANNTGIHIRNPAGWAGYIQTRTGTAPPALSVTTPNGTYDCACVASFWIDASSNASITGAQMTNVMLLRFDLSAVVGSPTSATMTLRTVSVPGGGMTLNVNRLDMPRLYYAPAIEVGGVVNGIAQSVVQDNLLGAHASVLCYDDLTSDAKFYGASRRFVTVNLGQPTGEAAAGHYYETLPQYGLTALVVKSSTTGPGIVDVHRWSQPMSAEPEAGSAWHRGYTVDQELGHTHLFFRYMLWIGEDVYAGMNEAGVKMSGLYGSYEWSTSGAVTLPDPDEDAKCVYRAEHSGKSAAAPHFYTFCTYEYDTDWGLGSHSGVGRVTKANVVRGAALRAGRWYCLEQELQLNTLVGNGLADPGGIANVNADGIERWWIDGVKVYEFTNLRCRGAKHANIQTIPYLTLYHGGTGAPLSQMTYKLAGVCVASEYIGPPKVIA
jgi:hypothetical protein